MYITFHTTMSDRRYLVKELSAGETLNGSLRNESSVISPTIVISADNPTEYNYAYIPDFHRYYYVENWQSIRTGIWEASLTVDVLTSFADGIRGAKIALQNTQEKEANNYLSSEIYKTSVKQVTDVLTFQNGLLEQGEYILITAGG